MNSGPVVWIAGDCGHADFAEALAWLGSRIRCSPVADTTLVASLRAEGAAPPKAILIVQSWSGQISRDEVERLHAAAPLARLVALVGPWCDGEARSGQPWPGVVRVPVNAWRHRLEKELGLAEDEARGCGPLPRTMTTAERLDASLSAVRRRENGRTITAIVYSCSRATYEAIADMLEQLGVRSVWKSEISAVIPTVDLAVFDGWELFAPSRRTAANGDDSVGPPRIMLLHFPRDKDYARAAAEGISAIVALPALMTDLAAAVRNATSQAAGPLACASGLY